MIKLANWLINLLNFVVSVSVNQVELAHSSLLKVVENFDKNDLQNVDTQEKIPLFDQEGNDIYLISIVYNVC